MGINTHIPGYGPFEFCLKCTSNNLSPAIKFEQPISIEQLKLDCSKFLVKKLNVETKFTLKYQYKGLNPTDYSEFQKFSLDTFFDRAGANLNDPTDNYSHCMKLVVDKPCTYKKYDAADPSINIEDPYPEFLQLNSNCVLED